ncbi:hypothetical protein CK203_112902 [Vitis vinifera]|uniref:DUF659 domain-containing protein n=1 Tax=Vitis vinifera TaxID=29760 RepID=A0A438EC17_VITVI|nr:hypothetical protein CK203_112902 [Vitis vinifera]
MGDGWTDNRQRTLMKFLVYCPEGISFVKFVDASDIVKDAKSSERQVETMNEMKLFRDRLGSFGRDITYSSREVLQPVDDDQPAKLDVEELENLLYEERSIPINEVEGSSSHIDDEDGGDVAIERLDVENFGFPDAHFQSLDSNFQNE